MAPSPRLPAGSCLQYVGGELYLEGVPVHTLAKEFGTPLFVYSKASAIGTLTSYTRGFNGHPHRIHYAMKANSNLAILQLFARAGCGFDIVSAGEFARALQAGAKPEYCVFSGVGKTASEIDYALSHGVGCFNVESRSELLLISQRALALDKTAPISLRVNPDVDAKTHPYISTGLRDNKFGIAHDEAINVYREAKELPGLQIVGIDCHIGSQITQITPFMDALERVLDLVDELSRVGIELSHIDLGGGLGIDYSGEDVPSPETLWRAVISRMKARGAGNYEVWCEPGRSLIGNAGICITKALVCKNTPEKNFLVVDAAMNDLPRPAMYGAFHEIVPATVGAGEASTWEVVGPVCESGDWIGKERSLSVSEGDLLAVCSTGAYSMSMSSQYNSRPRAAEVLIDGESVYVIRDRESVEDLWQREHLLP
jgi:diaminopimelate decarboxylase